MKKYAAGVLSNKHGQSMAPESMLVATSVQGCGAAQCNARALQQRTILGLRVGPCSGAPIAQARKARRATLVPRTCLSPHCPRRLPHWHSSYSLISSLHRQHSESGCVE
ncbi:hypothetical protein GQ54DRAFT_95596 [Martensiomyces pterosporus]|nr:hypothetical protein GQ54DRAFT_95596 [Martensiomyces pterosporus]